MVLSKCNHSRMRNTICWPSEISTVERSRTWWSSAQDLAANKDEALGMRHFRQVLDVYAKFGRDLRGGTGYEDAMRSYF